MELPALCSSCGNATMIDMDNLEREPLSKLEIWEGYQCEHCGTWKPVFLTTPSLDEAMKRLKTLSPLRPDFRYHFAKVLRKAKGVQERGAQNGSIRNQNMVAAG